MKKYDAVIIGTGPGGYHAAIRLAQLGRKVLAVEKGMVGGVCLNRGCIPTKALCRIAELKYKIPFLKEAGLDIELRNINFKEVQNWKNRVVSKLVKGIEFLFKKNGVELLKGEAKIESSNRVSVNGEEIETESIVIATGSLPVDLSEIKRDGEVVFYGEEALFFEDLPQSMLVIGAGPTGLELASIYSAFGTRVYVVEIMSQILPGFDSEISEYLRKVLLKKGIKIFLNSMVERIEKDTFAKVAVKTFEKEEVIEVEKIVISAGRRPVSEVLKYTDVKDEKGFIKTDNRLMTPIENIYAIGDVIGTPLLAHKAMNEGIQVAEIIAGKRKESTRHLIPSCVFTIPPVACIGLSEDEARKKGYKVKIGRFPYTASGRASTLGEREGFVKIVANDEGKIIGVHIIGEGADLMIGEGIVSVEEELDYRTIGEMVHPHPTLLEMIMEACENIDKKAIHILSQ